MNAIIQAIKGLVKKNIASELIRFVLLKELLW